jgi:hypothetical protein
MMNIEERLRALPWEAAERSLWDFGYAHVPGLLTREECKELAALYERPELFRSRIDMQRYRFGSGDYQYFDNPLPPLVSDLRTHGYPLVASIANRWMEAVGSEERFPALHDDFLAHCHAHGQTKPTPLLLHYEAGGFNCLHQDLYGDVAFPMQFMFLLSEPSRDFTGGDFLLVEQRPRAQSVGQAVHASQGDLVIFTTRYRPVKGSRGWYRANVKHGVSRVESGIRYTLGVIFHDAK